MQRHGSGEHRTRMFWEKTRHGSQGSAWGFILWIIYCTINKRTVQHKEAGTWVLIPHFPNCDNNYLFIFSSCSPSFLNTSFTTEESWIHPLFSILFCPCLVFFKIILKYKYYQWYDYFFCDNEFFKRLNVNFTKRQPQMFYWVFVLHSSRALFAIIHYVWVHSWFYDFNMSVNSVSFFIVYSANHFFFWLIRWHFRKQMWKCQWLTDISAPSDNVLGIT